METQLPLPNGSRAAALPFGPCLLWPNGWMDHDTAWYGGRPRPRRHCVRWGPSSPPPRKRVHQSPLFGQTAGCIRIPLGTEVGLGLGDNVLDGHPAHPIKRGTAARPLLFGPCLLWPNGLMDEDSIWYGGRPRPRRHCVRWGPSSHRKRGTAPNFRPMFVVAKRLYGSRCHLVRR